MLEQNERRDNLSLEQRVAEFHQTLLEVLVESGDIYHVHQEDKCIGDFAVYTSQASQTSAAGIEANPFVVKTDVYQCCEEFGYLAIPRDVPLYIGYNNDLSHLKVTPGEACVVNLDGENIQEVKEVGVLKHFEKMLKVGRPQTDVAPKWTFSAS